MKPLEGQVALVAGATRGAGRGIACMLGEAGAIVCCSGRSTREHPCTTGIYAGRPETIDETAEMVTTRGGRGIPVRCEHLVREQGEALLERALYRHGVAALAVTPGFMRTESILDHFGVTEHNWREAGRKDPNLLRSEAPYFVGRAVPALAADPRLMGKSGGLFSSWALAREYGFTDLDGSRPNWDEPVEWPDSLQPRTVFRWSILRERNP